MARKGQHFCNPLASKLEDGGALDLIQKLLACNPVERVTAAVDLGHWYFEEQ